ncbi:MAG: cyclase family protein [Alphaproteobacteria bacterium]|nr:cyclase family protein [Alphaproteobacteria bacterium]
MSTRWKRRPEGSTWGDFGPDDQLGRLNLLTPERVRRAVQEVREGITFCLSLPLDYPGGNKLNPRRHPPRLRATVREGRPNYLYPFGRDFPGSIDIVCDDAALLHLQYSTQWDSFAHMGSTFDADGDGVPEIVFYNGFRGGEHITIPASHGVPIVMDGAIPIEGGQQLEGVNAKRLGIERMAETCVQGRGVMIDLFSLFGRERKYVGYDEMMRAIAADKVEIETGDMICLYTGFGDVIMEMKGDPDAHMLENSCAVLNGRDERLLKWITDSNLAVLIADNYAVEAFPSRPGIAPCAFSPLHEHCLFKLGVHLGELFLLGPLARWLKQHKRTRFLLTAPPLRLPGAVGSPATPVATV